MVIFLLFILLFPLLNSTYYTLTGKTSIFSISWGRISVKNEKNFHIFFSVKNRNIFFRYFLVSYFFCEEP